jgi:hypothetical protein
MPYLTTTSILPPVCPWPIISDLTVCRTFMKFVVDVCDKRLSTEHDILCKLAQWKPYVTWGCKWISYPSFHICWHVWVKFDTEDLHTMPFINYALTKTSVLKTSPFLMSKMKSCAFIYKFLPIGIKSGAEGGRIKLSVHKFHENRLSGSRASAIRTFYIYCPIWAKFGKWYL